MKCLEISNGQAYFLNKNDQMELIDKITKDDILRLIDRITDPNVTDDFTIDDPAKNEIKNEAHKIIYDNLSDKLKQLIDNRTLFIDESNDTYREALDKYSK